MAAAAKIVDDKKISMVSIPDKSVPRIQDRNVHEPTRRNSESWGGLPPTPPLRFRLRRYGRTATGGRTYVWLACSAPVPCALGAASVPSALHPCPVAPKNKKNTPKYFPLPPWGQLRKRPKYFPLPPWGQLRTYDSVGNAGGGSRPPQTPPFASAFGDTDGVI